MVVLRIPRAPAHHVSRDGQREEALKQAVARVFVFGAGFLFCRFLTPGALRFMDTQLLSRLLDRLEGSTVTQRHLGALVLAAGHSAFLYFQEEPSQRGLRAVTTQFVATYLVANGLVGHPLLRFQRVLFRASINLLNQQPKACATVFAGVWLLEYEQNIQRGPFEAMDS